MNTIESTDSVRECVRELTARPSRSFRVLLITLLSLQVATGCGMFRPVKEFFVPEPMPPGFEKIDLRSAVDLKSDGELEGDTHSDSAVKGVTIGFATGAVTGGGVGFGLGVVSCVPTAFFYPFCVIIFVGFGIIIGFVGGGIAGGSTGLPWTTTNEVNKILDDIQRERDFNKEFRAAVMAAVPRRKQVSADRADVRVTAELDEVDLRQHFAQRLSMRMYASMKQEWPNRSSDPKSKTCRYRFTSQTMDVEDWVLHDGQLFNDTFSQGIETVAEWMARDLEAFISRRPQGEFGSTPATCFQPEG